jgi:Zn-dependent alcohol dehydrogenase
MVQILDAAKEGGPRADNEGGTAILLGIPMSEVAMDLSKVVLYQRHYSGSLGATDPNTDFPLFLSWARENKFPLARLVTDRYRLEQINEACTALEEGRILGRAIIEF